MNKAQKSASNKETTLKKANKTTRAQTLQPPSQAQVNGAKFKLFTASATTARPTAGGLNKHNLRTERATTVTLTKPSTDRGLSTNRLGISKDRGTVEILSYLEKGEQAKKKQKTKLPYKLGIDLKANDGFHTSSFQYNTDFGIFQPVVPATAPTATSGTARRTSVPAGAKKNISGKKLEVPTPIIVKTLGSKSELLNPANITPPNSLESAENIAVEPKASTGLRSVPSYDNLLAQVRKKIGTEGRQTKKPRSILRETETKTVMPVRTLTKTSSLQVMVPEHLKALKAKLDFHKNPTKTKMTLNANIEKAGISSLVPPSEAKKFENSTAKAIRSAIFEITNQESESDKVRKSLSIENTSSSEMKKDILKLKKTGMKGKLKKSTKSKSKILTHALSKEQFFEYQTKKVDEQFMHVYERQERLETEIRRLIDALEIEQAIRGTASHGLTPAPCCCSAEIRGKLKSLLQKQKQLIRLQIDLRKRYGVGPANWENQTDPDMPILNGYNMPYERFAAFAREEDGKMVYRCDNCNVSSDTELLFRLHLESPQHVVKAYRDIHSALPMFQCEGCDLGLKGTTKYMNHVTSDNVHLQKIPNPSTGVKRVKSSHSQQVLTLIHEGEGSEVDQ